MKDLLLWIALVCVAGLLLEDTGVCAAGRWRLWQQQSKDKIVAEVFHRRLQQAAGTYCVCASGASSTALQAALDWACGPQGNVDCSVLQQGGSCYNPNTLAAHASYAFDAYYVQQNGGEGSCNFGGTATTTSTNPSSGSCVYPSLGSSSSTTTTGSNSTSLSPASSRIILGSPPASNTSAASRHQRQGIGILPVCAVSLLLVLMRRG